MTHLPKTKAKPKMRQRPSSTKPDAERQKTLHLLREGIQVGFMGRTWRLIAGSEIERLLREEFKDCEVGGAFEGFLEWMTQEDGNGVPHSNSLPACLNLFDDDGETLGKLRCGVIELLNNYEHRNDDHEIARKEPHGHS